MKLQVMVIRALYSSQLIVWLAAPDESWRRAASGNMWTWDQDKGLPFDVASLVAFVKPKLVGDVYEWVSENIPASILATAYAVLEGASGERMPGGWLSSGGKYHYAAAGYAQTLCGGAGRVGKDMYAEQPGGAACQTCARLVVKLGRPE